MDIKSVILCLSAMGMFGCQEEPTPEVSLEGHWLVKHGIDDDECQVGATFFDGWMILTFHSNLPDACQPEQFGIDSNALPLRIENRKDYFDTQTVLTAELELSDLDLQVSGTVTLKESYSGLLGVVNEAYDPGGYLELLLGRDYALTAISEDWLALANSQQISECFELNSEGNIDCVVMEFSSATGGQLSAYRFRQGDDISFEGEAVESLEVTFALVNLESSSAGVHQLDLVIYPMAEGLADGLPASLTLSEEGSDLKLHIPLIQGDVTPLKVKYVLREMLE